MQPTLGTLDILHFLGATQGFFLALIFLFHTRGNLLANRFLGLLLAAFSLRLMEIVAFWTKYLLVFPHFALVAFPFSYLIGVFFYFYCVQLTTGSAKLQRIFWIHTIPFVAVVLYMIPFYALSSEIKLRIIQYWFIPQTPGTAQIPLPRLLSIVLQFPHALFYVGFAVRHLARYKTQTASPKRLDVLRIAWLQRLAIGFGLFFGLWLLYNLSFVFGFPYSKTFDQIITSAMTIFIYAIGYSAFRSPEIHHEFPGPKYEKSSLSPDLAERLVVQLKGLMATDKLYRKSDLNLSDLASKIGITPHQLSQVLNDKLKQGFFDYVNRMRIEEAQRMLADPVARHYTLLSIAYEVGFNNKTSFNQCFKKYTGLTPSQFRSNTPASASS